MATAAALIPAGVSLLGNILGKNASKKAQNAQNAMYQQALGQQQHQFDQTQANFQPYLSGGGAALASIKDLLGLSGNDPQSAAIAALKGSPGFTSLYDTGVDTILQNAAATGGLRGGNINNANSGQPNLPGFASSLLSQVIQNQLGNLGGIANMGVGAAGQIGQFGQNNSNATTNLLAAQGATTASGILGRAGMTNNFLNGLGGSLGGLPSLGGGVSANSMPDITKFLDLTKKGW